MDYNMKVSNSAEEELLFPKGHCAAANNTISHNWTLLLQGVINPASNDSLMHARLMNLCKSDIQRKLMQQKEDATKALFIQNCVANMSPQETCQLLQNTFKAPSVGPATGISSFASSTIADGRTLYGMNYVDVTTTNSVQPSVRYRLHEGSNKGEPNGSFKVPEHNVGHTSMRNQLGNVSTFQNMVQANIVTYPMQQFTIPFMSSPRMTQTTPASAVNIFQSSNTNLFARMYNSVPTPERSIPGKFQFCLAQPDDRDVLSEHQQFLRLQIEVFEASESDVRTHVRGRNKPIVLGQVGIRCRHCAHLLPSRRQKGSTYFPASTIGLYQAAQNMCTAHIQCGRCSEMPDHIKERFKDLIATKSFTTGAGKPYWSKSAKSMGLVDTENGIFFSSNVSHLK